MSSYAIVLEGRDAGEVSGREGQSKRTCNLRSGNDTTGEEDDDYDVLRINAMASVRHGERKDHRSTIAIFITAFIIHTHILCINNWQTCTHILETSN